MIVKKNESLLDQTLKNNIDDIDILTAVTAVHNPSTKSGGSFNYSGCVYFFGSAALFLIRLYFIRHDYYFAYLGPSAYLRELWGTRAGSANGPTNINDFYYNWHDGNFVPKFRAPSAEFYQQTNKFLSHFENQEIPDSLISAGLKAFRPGSACAKIFGKLCRDHNSSFVPVESNTFSHWCYSWFFSARFDTTKYLHGNGTPYTVQVKKYFGTFSYEYQIKEDGGFFVTIEKFLQNLGAEKVPSSCYLVLKSAVSYPQLNIKPEVWHRLISENAFWIHPDPIAVMEAHGIAFISEDLKFCIRVTEIVDGVIASQP